MKKTTQFFLLFIGILFILESCNDAPKAIEIESNDTTTIETAEAITLTQSQFDLAKMQLGQLSAYSFPDAIRASGKVEIPTKNKIRVSAYAGGYVRFINLVVGQYVKKGQLLFSLENPDFVLMQQEYLEAKEHLTYLKSDYERQKKLADENVASSKSYIKAETDYKVTLAKMEGMKKRLSLLKINPDNITPQNMESTISIYAPDNGYITEVMAMKGMFLNPSDVAISLLNTEDIHLELNVFEKDILKLKEGQKILFKIPDASNDSYEGMVHLIGKIVDEEKRVVRVHAHIKNKKDELKMVAGMYVDAEIITEENESKGIPETAIVSEEDKDFVLILKETKDGLNVFKKKEVQIGQRKNGLVQILNHKDITATDKILIEGAFNLVGME